MMGESVHFGRSPYRGTYRVFRARGGDFLGIVTRYGRRGQWWAFGPEADEANPRGSEVVAQEWSRKGAAEALLSPGNPMKTKRRGREKRGNPSLVLLHNPSAGTRVPREREAREAWGEFHLRDGRNADVITIPDIRGLPETVMVLGAFEGVELVRRRSPRAPAETVEWKRNNKSGPWLVASADLRTLWIVSAKRSHLSRLQSFDGWYVKAVYYYPQRSSGKHHATMAYRHEFGEDGGSRPKSRWHHYYPALKMIGDRAAHLVRPEDGYTVEDVGIKG